MPFTPQQFFDLFAVYNTAIWPAQVVAYVLGIAAVVLASRESAVAGRIVSGILAAFWIWIGVVYHIGYFRAINGAALLFGVLFIIQGILFLAAKVSFRLSLEPLPIIGAIFIVYAMLLYPLIGIAAGHAYPRAPMFGVVPCPSTIFTFGLLLWAIRRVPFWLLVIPLLWSFLGVSAAMSLHVPQDYGLAVAGVLGTLLIVIHNRGARQKPLAPAHA